MSILKKTFIIVTSLALLSGLFVLPTFAATTESPPISMTRVGPWTVATIAQENDGWIIESYKVDRDLVAWTELNSAASQRRLKVFDGVTVRTLAVMNASDWNDADKAFVEPVAGDYDAADGIVVWIQKDGNGRKVFVFDGVNTTKIEDNSTDAKHPVTSRGRVAWTIVQGGSYGLMIKDRKGMRRLATWNVMNYAFSGQNIFWLNRLPNENWFRVFRENGNDILPVQQGDDRPIVKYFYTDGKGSAAWEYSTKNWSYDKRIVYLSDSGNLAIPVLQRDVPPNLINIEDVDGGRVLMNATDLLTSLVNDTILIRTSGFVQKYLNRQTVMAKARFMDGGIVRHVVPENATAIVFEGNEQGRDWITLDTVIYNRFEADGDTAAGALLKGGLVTYYQSKTYVIPSPLQANNLSVKGSTIAWTEGTNGTSALKVAAHQVLVKSGAGTKYVSGRLVKGVNSSSVYLAALDGKRYRIPSEGEFRGWYPDFNSVRTVPNTVLSALPLAGKVLYRPGYKLVKSSSSPRVYSVAPNGTLHWITDSYVLSAFYGSSWQNRIATLPDSEFAEYAVGDSINDIQHYQVALK